YKLISLDEMVERLRSGKNERVSASITFDDGYKDNAWAIEYLQYFGIPASFFVSVGHIRDGSAFEHDHRRGFHGAPPISQADVRRLASEGFIVGSHAIYHEDFGRLDAVTADAVLRESREAIGHLTERAPEHFSFPKGQWGTNITVETFAAAKKYYPYLYSAYGGYNHPRVNRRHFSRIANPTALLELVMTMDGYSGFRRCLRGDAWGIETDARVPC